MRKIILAFNRYTEAALLVIAQAILKAMTGNTFFPTPTPSLTVIQTAIDDYMAALSAAQEGGKTNIATKNAKKQILINLLIELGNYVTLTANGNEVMLVSSGFPLSKERQPLPPLEQPQIIKIANGNNAGELEVTINAVKGSRTYLYQYTLDPLTESSTWTSANSTLVKHNFYQLETGKKYWCRVVVYGTNEQQVFSNPVLSKLVQ